MYKYLYLLLKQRIVAKVTAVKNVDWYFDNDAPQKGHLRILPAAYIRFLPTPMHSIGEGVQEAVLQFEVILLSDCLYDADKRIDDTTAIDHMDIVTQLHQAISGYSANLSSVTGYTSLLNTDADVPVMNTIDRTGIDHHHTRGAIMKTVQSFSCSAKDYSGSKQFTHLLKTLLIEEKKIGI